MSRPRALLTAIFCAFAALLPIVSVMAPKGTVVLLLLAAALAVPTYWWAHRRFPIPDLRISIALALLVVWCAIASAWSDDPTRSLVLALRIAVIFAAGMVLFPIVATLDDAAKNRIGLWLVAGFGLSLALTAVEVGLDYPLLRSFKEANAGNEAVWFNRGAVAMALIVWPLAAYLWSRGLGWKALVIPVLLGIASFFLESAAATLGFLAGVVTLLLVLSHRKAGLVVTIAASVLVFVGMPFAAREMHSHGWHRADWLVASAQHRVEIWGLFCSTDCREAVAGMGIRRIAPYRRAVPGCRRHRSRGSWRCTPITRRYKSCLSLAAVGAVVALALLGLVAVRLGATPHRGRTFAQAFFVSALAIGSVAYGLWQNWWLALIVSVALLAPLTASSRVRDGEMDNNYGKASNF